MKASNGEKERSPRDAANEANLNAIVRLVKAAKDDPLPVRLLQTIFDGVVRVIREIGRFFGGPGERGPEAR